MPESIAKKLENVEAAVMEQYGQISPAERAARMLAALSRDDEDEKVRLRSSCPRKSYTMSDAAYGDRMQFAQEIALAFALDLRHACGKLTMLTLLAAHLDSVLQKHTVLANLAFVDGWRVGKDIPPEEPFLEPPPQECPAPGHPLPQPRPMERYLRNDAAEDGVGAPDGEEASDDGNGGEDDGPEPPEVAEFFEQLEQVEQRTRDATQELRDALALASRTVVKDIAAIWAALGTFTPRRLGVGPEVLYRAWSPIVADEVLASLALHPGVKPKKADVAEILDILEGAWTRQIGDADDAEDDHRTYGS
jgi:hypothetical protein